MEDAVRATAPRSASEPVLDVFIVEGSAAVRERLEELVASVRGARCAGTAATAEAAIRGIRARRPAAVVLDIKLEQGSGFDVLRALRKSRSETPVYVLSNFTDEPYRRAALQLGAAAVLDKSAQIERLRELLDAQAARLGRSPH
ncbi:MAG TPA: response regulator [Burkholderiales bacterium]|nr:response regulator [Burkholderiales bacterium]